jgi:molybdate transport system ATP-binding protein
MSMSLSVRLQLTLRQGEFTLTVDEAFEARVLALYGPSGAGKTSLLEAIAGWREPQAGEIAVGGRLLYASARGINVPVARRGVGYVPQDGLLFPHLTVRGNVAYGLPTTGARPDAVDRVSAILDLGELVERPVSTLSGGERQRVALARALVASPAILLLDEPLGGVDAARRQRILPYVSRVRDELNVPMIYVTHQAHEARAVADQVLMLDEGRVVNRGSVDLLPS